MNHPIPAPRRPVDTRPAHLTGTIRTPAPPRPAPQSGPACASCAHHACRAQRARTLPRLGGHRAEFSREHHQAAQIQARHPHLLVYFGEATQSFWIATPSGLIEARDVDELLLKLWPHIDRPALRPWARALGRPRILALV
ncbi:hypothetical protein [Nocardiopsis alkaliphila]|uniref:hypothetical protein n=1 Tax=Nocardiopsis alkaliphila TaxID=225762 RepID=UPI00037C6AB4|nr:hypothetical protein [Nocardiopsis alkaliphila]